jgi:uncharacterized membrane protein
MFPMPSFDQIQHLHPHRFMIAAWLWLAGSALTALTIILPGFRLPDRSDRMKRAAVAGSINWLWLAVLAIWYFMAK